MKKNHIIRAALVAALTVTATLSAQTLIGVPPETPAERTARELLAAPTQTRDVLLNQIDDASQRLWLSPDPAAVLVALGPNAAALFADNGDFGTLVAQFLTAKNDTAGLARLQSIAARIPPVTIHGNGTVTINPTPTPSPEP
jgi:hypothetical protein